MTITSYHILTDDKQLALKALVGECNLHDGTLPEMHWPLVNASSLHPSTFLFEQKNQLLGFLKLFFFHENSIDMVLLVHPSFRKQGIATQLMNAAMPLLAKEKIKDVCFSFANKNCAWLEKKGAKYSDSSHTLSHALSTIKPCTHKISLATPLNTQDLIELDILCFKQRSLTSKRIETLIKTKTYDILVIMIENKAIAKLHLQYLKDTAEIFDVAVHPSYQHQGYATSLVRHALNCAKRLNKKSVSLTVSSHNQNALSLYLNNGFDCVQTQHHWQFIC